MSSHAKVIRFYGVSLTRRESEAVPAPGDDVSDDSPWGRAWAAQQPADGVVVGEFGFYDQPRLFVAAAGSVAIGGLWEPLPLPVVFPIQTDAAVKAYCETWGLPVREPGWYAVPYYG